MDAAAAARHDQQLAWIVLRDRGWPSAHRTTGVDPATVRAWLRTWAHFVSLPDRLTSAQELIRSQLIRRHLERWETALRSDLPADVWGVIGPLDRTGRATLACVLQALDRWWLTTERCDALSGEKRRLSRELAAIGDEVRPLGFQVPWAPLDLDAWAMIAAAVLGTNAPPPQSAMP